MVGFLIGEAFRDLRRAGRVAVSAVVLITLSLAALGGFRLLASNLGQAVVQWRDRVRIIVYLKREPAREEATGLAERARELPGVAAVRYVDRTEALATLRRALGKDAGVADQLPSNPLPASLEVTPSERGATPEGARALIERLAAFPEAEEVAGGTEWIERFAHWRRLVTLIGLGVGGVLAVAAILTVTTATTLVLHARRDETEVMRLVGAPESIIRMPLLLQGMLQGLAGALLALAALVGSYALVAPRLGPLVTLTLGLPRLAFLPPPDMLGLVLAGTLLGGLGGLLARGHVDR